MALEDTADAIEGSSTCVSERGACGRVAVTVPAVCHNHPVRVLGVDLGLKRIGLAVSDASGTLARPLRTLARGASDREATRMLADVVDALRAEEDGLGAIVIGLPTRLDGSPHAQTAHVRQVADALARRVRLPIVLQDERLSSHEADSRLAATRRDWRTRKARLDAAAAAVILQDYLDSTAHAAPRPAPEE
jgi:putative Holliday junction resolvase